MRKIICYIATSLDGFIAGEDGSVDWLDKYDDADYDYQDFADSVDTILMGSGTYIKSLDFGDAGFMADKTYYVFTRKTNLPGRDNVHFTHATPRDFCASILSTPGKHLWMIGGGLLLSAFLEASLIDELMVFVMPEMIGSGIPLFPGGDIQMSWRLQHQKSWDNGVVLLHYCRV